MIVPTDIMSTSFNRTFTLCVLSTTQINWLSEKWGFDYFMFQRYNTSILPSTEVAYHLMFISFCQAVIRENVFHLTHVLSRTKMQYVKNCRQPTITFKNAVSGRLLYAFCHELSFWCTSCRNYCPDFFQWFPLMWTENDMCSVILVHFLCLKLISCTLQLWSFKGNILKV